MRRLILLPVLTLVLHAGETLPERLQKVQRLSPDTLRQLQVELASSAAPVEAKAYHEAHLAYHLAARRLAKEPAMDLALVERAIQILEPRKDAESRALLGACLGVKIRFNPESAMTLAPKAAALFEMALEQSPGNPRALMLQGVFVLNTPSVFGGGAEAALPLLAAAVKAAEAEKGPKNGWEPAWGRVESLAWLGMAEAQLGQMAQAKVHVNQALALDENFGFARFVVLPKVQEGVK